MHLQMHTCQAHICRGIQLSAHMHVCCQVHTYRCILTITHPQVCTEDTVCSVGILCHSSTFRNYVRAAACWHGGAVCTPLIRRSASSRDGPSRRSALRPARFEFVAKGLGDDAARGTQHCSVGAAALPKASVPMLRITQISLPIKRSSTHRLTQSLMRKGTGLPRGAAFVKWNRLSVFCIRISRGIRPS